MLCRQRAQKRDQITGFTSHFGPKRWKKLKLNTESSNLRFLLNLQSLKNEKLIQETKDILNNLSTCFVIDAKSSLRNSCKGIFYYHELTLSTRLIDSKTNYKMPNFS